MTKSMEAPNDEDRGLRIGDCKQRMIILAFEARNDTS